jgi:tetratricopeptide (TPR) repeat protein
MASGKKDHSRNRQEPAVQRPVPPRTPLEKISTPPWSIAIILGLILVCYFQTLSFQWTRFDDDLIITNHLETYRDLSKAGRAFTTDAFNNEKGGNFYRPMQNLSFFLDAHFSGDSPAGFKLTNLLLHFLTCVCLLLLFRLLKLDAKLSWIAVLLFSAHPLFSHAVVWIPSRGDLFIALFGILSYITFLQVIGNDGVHFLALHFTAFLMAVFSKETALFLPLVFALHLFLFCRPFKISAVHYRLFSIWLAAVSIYLVARSQVIVTSAKSDEFGIGPLLGNLRTLPEFLSKFAFPFGLSVMPVFSVSLTLTGTVLVILIGGYVITAREPARRLGMIGIAWFVLFTSITMLYRNGLGSAAYDYLEHRAYMPAIGILIVLVAFLQEKLPRAQMRNTYIAGFAIASVLATVTIVHSRDYKDPLSFYAAATRFNPGCAMAYYNRAQYKRSLGDRTGAILDYDEAIRVKPDLADAYYNRGNAKKDGGDLNGAISDYGEAIRCRSGFELAYYNRGTVRLNMGDGNGAVEDFSAALNVNPRNARTLNNRGAAYYSMGQADPAVSDFSGAVEADPSYGDAWRNRGSVRFANRDVAGACSDWRAGERVGSAESAKLLLQHCR